VTTAGLCFAALCLLQELDRLSRETSQLRAAAEEAKDARQKLQSQLDEANSGLSQLQALVSKQSSCSKGVSPAP
jgi:septal ring factor EnvC (AmiA/AmiB activator)